MQVVRGRWLSQCRVKGDMPKCGWGLSPSLGSLGVQSPNTARERSYKEQIHRCYPVALRTRSTHLYPALCPAWLAHRVYTHGFPEALASGTLLCALHGWPTGYIPMGS